MEKEYLKEMCEYARKESIVHGCQRIEVESPVAIMFVQGKTLNLWTNNGYNSAGKYAYPSEFDLLYDRYVWLLENKEHTVCCDCRKKLESKGHYKLFAGNYCDECWEKVKNEPDPPID